MAALYCLEVACQGSIFGLDHVPPICMLCECVTGPCNYSQASLLSKDERQMPNACNVDIGHWKSILNLSLPTCRHI